MVARREGGGTSAFHEVEEVVGRAACAAPLSSRGGSGGFCRSSHAPSTSPSSRYGGTAGTVGAVEGGGEVSVGHADGGAGEGERTCGRPWGGGGGAAAVVAPFSAGHRSKSTLAFITAATVG